MLSDTALKHQLIAELELIPDTSMTGTSLESLTNVLTRASSVLEKFKGRSTKRANEAMLNTYNYPFELSPSRQYDMDSIEHNKRHRVEEDALMAEVAKSWTSEQKAQNIQETLQQETLHARMAAQVESSRIKHEEKEGALALWYEKFCRDVDSKIATIPSNPGYSSEIVEPVAKKSKANPTPVQIRISLGNSFREEIADHDVLVSSLYAQLKTAQEIEAKVMKTFNIRKEKAHVLKVAMAEHRAAKKEGKASVAPKKANGCKTEWDVKIQDHSDLELANWFKLHSIAIQDKITLLTPVV